MAVGTMKIDFTGVSDSFENLPNGKYAAKVKEIEQKPSKSSDFPYLEWTLVIVQGAHKGRQIIHRTSLSPKALFKLREMLISMGMNVPKSAINIPFDKLIGRTLGIEIGKRKADDGKEYDEVKNTFVLPKSGSPAPVAPTPHPAPVSTTEDIPFSLDDEDVVLDLGD